MKVIFTLAILCVLLPMYAQQTFKGISYNIRWNNLDDDEDQWDFRKDAIGNFLAEENADFVGLQEAMVDQVFFVEEYLEFYKYIGVGRDDGELKGEFCPIFYNTLKWEMLEMGNIWLSETPEEVSRGWDAACNRVVSFGLFRHKNSNDTIAVFNTHLDHEGEKARINSIETLNNYVVEKSQGFPQIILGDFNFTPETRLHESISKYWNDAREHATRRFEEHRGTYNGFKVDGRYNRRIDYLFASSELGVLLYDCPELRIDGRHLSDHFPVIAILKFNANN